mmetsp:Transcript_66183/g.115341  ORF Transcript_66183/g.115341 Transcript_66183/m.115341 type:complete len:217 (-) Transcript_66183:1094-1744(-)
MIQLVIAPEAPVGVQAEAPPEKSFWFAASGIRRVTFASFLRAFSKNLVATAESSQAHTCHVLSWTGNWQQFPPFPLPVAGRLRISQTRQAEVAHGQHRLCPSMWAVAASADHQDSSPGLAMGIPVQSSPADPVRPSSARCCLASQAGPAVPAAPASKAKPARLLPGSQDGPELSPHVRTSSACAPARRAALQTSPGHHSVPGASLRCSWLAPVPYA